MSKQELFNKTLEAKKSMQLALDHIQATKHNDGEYERGMRNAFADCVRWIDELYSETDEPKKEVVPLPRKVIEKIEKLEQLDVSMTEIYEDFYALEFWEDEEMFNWFHNADNSDTLMRALVNGYEVEKEPVWVVENENGYRLHSIVASPGNSLNWSFDSKNKNYIEFEEFETAKKAAYLVTGNVTEIKM